MNRFRRSFRLGLLAADIPKADIGARSGMLARLDADAMIALTDLRNSLPRLHLESTNMDFGWVSFKSLYMYIRRKANKTNQVPTYKYLQ